METNAFSRVAMGNDAEHHILAGGDDSAVALQRQWIVGACAMPHTEPMPDIAVRWRLPRYCAPVAGASFMFEITRDSDILEWMSPECSSPFELAAAQEVTRAFFRERLRGRVALGACGYVRGRRDGPAYTYAGSHLNVSLNNSSLPDTRTALQDPLAQQAMLFLLATSQVWSGIGTHALEFECRNRAIATDISNECVSNKGLLQPGRPIPRLERKEPTFHWTHFESGWSRSQRQRALAAATVALDTHLGCHHTGEVVSFLHDRGLSVPPEEPWYRLRLALSQCFGERFHKAVRIGAREWTHLDLLALRLALYDQLITDREKTEVGWVSWALEQLRALHEAMAVYPEVVSGPLLGLDAIVKHEYVFRPFAESRGYDLKLLAEYYRQALGGGAVARHGLSPEIREADDELFGLNLLYHDFTIRDGLYSDVLQAQPLVASWQRVEEVEAACERPLPPTRSRRRQRLMEAYAAVSEASRGRLVPCFAGFDTIAVRIRSQDAEDQFHEHHLEGVLCSRVSREDWAIVRQLADLVGVNAEQVLAQTAPV